MAYMKRETSGKKSATPMKMMRTQTPRTEKKMKVTATPIEEKKSMKMQRTATPRNNVASGTRTATPRITGNKTKKKLY